MAITLRQFIALHDNKYHAQDILAICDSEGWDLQTVTFEEIDKIDKDYLDSEILNFGEFHGQIYVCLPFPVW